jgi:hypothetical protein
MKNSRLILLSVALIAFIYISSQPQQPEAFRNQVFTVATEIRDINKLSQVNPPFENAKILLNEVAVWINILKIGNGVTKDIAKTKGVLYKLELKFNTLNQLITEWNNLVDDACILKSDSSDSEFERFSQKFVSFVLKGSYLYATSGGYSGKYALVVGVLDAINLPSTLRQMLVPTIENLNISIGNIDEDVFTIIDTVGNQFGPQLFQTTSIIQSEIENEAMPFARNVINNLNITIILS